MEDYQIWDSEYRFMCIVWANAPVGSGKLVELCAAELGWKKSTTYTVLKRLCQRGLFENRDGTVIPLLSKEEFDARQSEEFVEESFGGSLPQFLAAFTRRKKLSDQEVAALQALIDESRRQS